MSTAQTRRITRARIGGIVGGIVGGIALAGLAAPTASAAPDCSQTGVDNAVATVTQQAKAYMSAHPPVSKLLMTAAGQSQSQAAQTISAYASANPQEYSEFKAILTPLSTLQKQCGVQVIPTEYEWAFNQFIG
ncbi:MAG: hemophore-related protein [Mycobacterium sp.]